MISYIKGTLERRAETYIIIETGGIGYRIFVSPATLAKLPQTGAEAKVYTYFSVKEDGMSLILTGKVFPDKLKPYVDAISTIDYIEVDKGKEGC